MTATATRTPGPISPPRTTAAMAVTVARRALVSGLSRWTALGPGRPRKSGTPRSAAGMTSLRRALPATHPPRPRAVGLLEQRLALREAGLHAPRHRGEDEVDDEEGRDLVDRVADQALAERRGADVGSRLAERGDEEVGARAGHAAEEVGADRRADDRRHDPGEQPGDDDVRGGQVATDEEHERAARAPCRPRGRTPPSRGSRTRCCRSRPRRRSGRGSPGSRGRPARTCRR